MVKSVYVPEAGGILDFADDITPQEMSRYINAKYPRAAAAAPAPTPDESGVLGRFAYGLATGITDIPGGIAALGLPAEKAAKSDAGQFSESARKYLQETLGIDPTKEATTAQMLAQGLGSAAGFLIPGGAAAKGVSLLGKGAALAGESAALAGRAGTITAAGQGVALGASQRAQTIQQQLASGMNISESEQLSSQQLSGLIGLSEALPMQKFFGPLNVLLSKVPASKAPIVERIISSRIAKLTKAGTQEAAQEAASGIANDLMEYGVYNPDVQIGQDLLSNAAGGAFAGSVIEGVIQIAAGRKLRGARQLQADIRAETQQNAADLRQARIADAADKLRESGAEGTLTVEENEDPEGNRRFTVMNEKGDPLVDMYGIGQEGAAEAINIYKQNTGANVSLKIKETPKLDPVRIGGRRFPTIEAAYAEREKIRKHVQTLEAYGNDINRVSKEAALRGQQPGVLFKQIQDSLKTHRNNLAMFDRYFSVDVGPEPVMPGPKVKAPEVPAEAPEPVAAAPVEEAVSEEPSPEFTDEDFTAEVPAQEAGSPDEPITSEEQVPEMPIGAVEMPVEESRVLPDEIVDSATGPIPAAEPVDVKVEKRPAATVEDLAALQTELFGKPTNIREMTDEQRAVYEAERDRRFPPQDVDTYYAAGYAGEAVPKNLREAAINGPVVKDYTPETQKWMKDVYTRLLSQVENVVPDSVKLELKTLIDAPSGYLVRGQENAIETQYGIKSIVDLSTGVLKPGMTVEAAVKELAKTLNHEIIHVLRTKGVIRQSEWRVLANSVANTKVKGKAYTYLDKAEAVYTPIGEDGIARPISKVYENPDAVIEEAVADLYRDWIDGKVGYTSGAGLLNRIREFFRRIFQTLRNARHEEVFAKIAKGEVGRRTDGVPRKSGERFSVAPLYNALDSTSDWETSGSPPPAISSVNRTGGSPFRISQRRPTAVKARGRSIGENLLVNVDAMKEDMAAYVHNVGILNSYPMFRVRPGEDVNDTLKRFKEDVVSNLLWLHDQMDPDLRKRAKLWYDGARKITDDLAKQYNLPDTSVAAVIATQSPQKDWFQNVSLAERVIDIMSTKQDVKFNNAMLKNALGRESMQAYAPLLNMMYGKKLKDLGKFTEQDFIKALGKNVPEQAKLKKDVERANKLAKAIFIRFYDEVYNPRTFYIITPEGNRGSVATTNSGDEQKVAWGTFDMISKGVQAFEDGSKENIDEVLGDQHKIRNFYNNIISPMSSDGSVTIDTHAVAAAHIRPLSGGSDEVHHNFGTSDKNVLLKTANSSVTGVQGLYAIYADAYREAAAKRGVLPREMQSITWEAVRGLYKPTFKAQAKNVSAIDAIWARYKSGEINVNEVRNQILNYADPGAVGINNPFWRNESDAFVYEAGRDSGDTRKLGADVVGEAAGPVGRGATRRDAGSAAGRVKFSAAPVVNSEEFRRWFGNSKVVNPDGTPKVVYHGTDTKALIDTLGAPTFFTDHPDEASAYTYWKSADKRQKLLSKEKYRIIPGSGGINITRVPYVGIISDIPYEDRGKIYATDEGVVRVNEDGTVDMFTGWVTDYDSNADDYNISIKRGDGSANAQKLIDERRELIDERYPAGEGENGRVYPVYLSIKNPIRLSALDANRLGARLGVMSKDEALAYVAELESKGYDGIVTSSDEATMFPDVYNALGRVPEQYIPFRPEQVKSIFNQFQTGTAQSVRFSAAPLPPYVEQQNETLFVKTPKVPFKNMIFDWAFGHHPEGKTIKVNGRDVPISQWTMTGVAGKAAAVDNAAFMTEIEKTFNRETTGNYQRMQADYSATAAIAWLRRSSHIMASMMLRGNLSLNYDRPGDIMSATMKVQDDPDSLKEVFKIMTQPAYGDKTKADIFKTYAVAKRGEWLRSTGQTVPRELTPQYIREAIDSVQRDYPDVVEAYNMYQRFNKKLMTTVRDAGLISTAELGRLTNQMNYYGFIYEMYGEPLGPNSPQKAASQFKLRPYTGSQYGGLVNDPMFVMIQNAQFMVTSVAKNLAATKSLKLAELVGEARLLQTNEAPNEFQGEQPDVMFMSENGVVKRYAVKDPLMVTALGADDRINVGKFWETLGLPAHILRESVTRDPGFMARNLMRDTVAAWMNSGVNFVPVIDTLKNFGLALKGGGSFKDLSARGVVGSYDLAMQTPKELSQTFRQNLPGNVHMPTSVEGLNAGIRSLWNRLGHVSEASDAATRMAVYDALIKEGMTEAEAAMQAIELLDFTRRGASQTLGILTKLIPFLNARIQGFDVLYQAGRSAIRVASGRSLGERDSRVGKKFLIRGAMLAAISVALEMLNQDDEDYAQIEDYVKNGNLLIPLKEFGLKGQFIAIPKPFENGLLFSTIPQQMYKTMTGEASTRENVELFWGQLAGTFGVNPIPQALLPPIEIITNHNFFTGLPLISEGKARLAPELQYNTSTSQLAMMIGSLPIFYDFSTGRFGGASPIIIDKLISGYGGPVGTYFAQGIGLAMQDVANIGPERMPIELSNAPVVRSFFVDAKSKNPKVVTQAYELFRIADEANRTVSRLKQMNDAEALADYVAKNRDILTYKKYIFKLTDSLNKLSAQERAVERDTQMTREEKFAAQKKLREVRIQLASKVDMINQKIGR